MSWNFEQFVKERRYLHNVSERTIQWYEESFKWLGRFEATEQGLKDFVIAMRQAGLKPISCNNRIRVANAYCKWAKLPLHIDRLKEEQRQLPTLTADQLGTLLAFRPRGFYQSRLYTVILTLADTGLRIEEALCLERSKVDFDNLLLTVTG
jgi:integrase/recombinase XerD